MFRQTEHQESRDKTILQVEIQGQLIRQGKIQGICRIRQAHANSLGFAQGSPGISAAEESVNGTKTAPRGKQGKGSLEFRAAIRHPHDAASTTCRKELPSRGARAVTRIPAPRHRKAPRVRYPSTAVTRAGCLPARPNAIATMPKSATKTGLRRKPWGPQRRNHRYCVGSERGPSRNWSRVVCSHPHLERRRRRSDRASDRALGFFFLLFCAFTHPTHSHWSSHRGKAHPPSG